MKKIQSPGVLHFSSKSEAARARTVMYESDEGPAARRPSAEEKP
jgi:hypothetical protein